MNVSKGRLFSILILIFNNIIMWMWNVPKGKDVEQKYWFALISQLHYAHHYLLCLKAYTQTHTKEREKKKESERAMSIERRRSTSTFDLLHVEKWFPRSDVIHTKIRFENVLAFRFLRIIIYFLFLCSSFVFFFSFVSLIYSMNCDVDK